VGANASTATAAVGTVAASAASGTDIPAINIQRGRDHGVPDYNACRRALGLPAAKTFSDITPDQDVAAVLTQLYGNVNNIGMSLVLCQLHPPPRRRVFCGWLV
jgi:hypothetical protein